MVEWEDAIERLKNIPLKETLEKLELSYIGLEDDYKEIFLDIACILKGRKKEDAIRILEYCGFHARNGLKVLEQRSLVTVKYGCLGMHDHIEEMGKNIVRRSHPDEPNRHSRLWINEEIEDILANDMGTEEARCLKLDMSRENSRILMKGLGKLKKLRYLEVSFADSDSEYDSGSDSESLGSEDYDLESDRESDGGVDPQFDDTSQLDDSTQYFPNSLKYVNWEGYPFLYLPKTFQANNLVGLEMNYGKMVQLWEDGEKKVLKKLKFLSLSMLNLTTFDFRITPNLETLYFGDSPNLAELFMPVCCQKLKHLDISGSKLRTFNLGLTPNLEKLSLKDSSNLVELLMRVTFRKLTYIYISDSKLKTIDLGLTPNLETLFLNNSCYLVELCMPVSCKKLKEIHISFSKLITFDLGLTPNLETLSLFACDVELHVSVACPNLKVLNLNFSRLRRLDLELIPNLESLDLENCDELVKINAPVGCLKKVVYFKLSGGLRFTDFKFNTEPIQVYHSSAVLNVVGKSVDLCPLHPNSNLLKLRFRCSYNEDLPSSVGNIEKLISFGLCTCTNFKKFSKKICSLRCLRKLKLQCNIPEFPKNLGKLKCLEELCLLSMKTKHLPDSICMLKRLKFLKVDGDLLEKLPDDLDQLECLEKLYVRSKTIEFLPDSICMLKRLKWLDVTYCSSLGKLPEDIGRIECLERLDLSLTMIKHLPQSIFGLKGLFIAASRELLQLYDFPSSWRLRWKLGKS